MDASTFENVHIRHYGLTPSVAASYYEAMKVTLDRHHVPAVKLILLDNGSQTFESLSWPPTSARERAAWNNVDDATRDGAYCLALTSVEILRGLVAVRRAETRTGADYYVAPRDADVADFENLVRVEVSGINSGTKAMADYRLSQKLSQAGRGDSNLPAIAVVVEFSAPLVSAADLT